MTDTAASDGARPPEQTTPKAYNVKEFCRVFGVGKTFAHGLISAGVLRKKYAGKRLLITGASAQDWFDNLPDEPPRDRPSPPTKLRVAQSQ